MEQGMRIRLQMNSFVEGIHHQRIIIMVADLKGNDPAVIQIQNGTQIYFMDLDADLILKLCHIGQPFFIWRNRMKVPVQVIPGDMYRIVRCSCTTLWLPLYSRLYAVLTT